MEIGDKVIADGSVGIIVAEYNKSTRFDWEVAFIENPPCNCWLDCYEEEFLTPYTWKKYPKTFTQKFKLLLKHITE